MHYASPLFFVKEKLKLKKIVITAVLYSVVALAQAELVSDKNDNKVGDVNLDVLLEGAPVGPQIKLLKNKQEVKKQLELLYLREVMAKMAVEEGLDKEGINAERLQAMRNNALYLLKLQALKESSARDYGKYAKQVYLANQQDYLKEEKVDAAHILISTKKMSSDEALKKANKIRQQLMQGEKFSTLALKESDDKTVQKNKGELGEFTSNQMEVPFSEAVFSMQVGEISEPVMTKYGLHIIKLNKKIPARVETFEEAKPDIIARLEKKDWEATRSGFFAKIKKDNEMQIDDVALDLFITKKLAELEEK